MNTDYLRAEKSRIKILGKSVVCRFCSDDIFVPYEVYINVEQPGIGCLHSRYIAICQSCGHAKHFGDPSFYDAAKDEYIWALAQYEISEFTSNH